MLGDVELRNARTLDQNDVEVAVPGLEVRLEGVPERAVEDGRHSSEVAELVYLVPNGGVHQPKGIGVRLSHRGGVDRREVGLDEPHPPLWTYKTPQKNQKITPPKVRFFLSQRSVEFGWLGVEGWLGGAHSVETKTKGRSPRFPGSPA